MLTFSKNPVKNGHIIKSKKPPDHPKAPLLKFAPKMLTSVNLSAIGKWIV